MSKPAALHAPWDTNKKICIEFSVCRGACTVHPVNHNSVSNSFLFFFPKLSVLTSKEDILSLDQKKKKKQTKKETKNPQLFYSITEYYGVHWKILELFYPLFGF